MEYNNVKERIERLYSAVQIPISDGVSEYLAVDKDPHSNSAHFKTNQNATTNKIIMIISHISNLKDHLKNIIEKRGGDKNIVERYIDICLPLQIVIDLNNAEKHGYPVKSKRSKIDPKICNVKSSLKVHGDGQTSIAINFSTKEIVKNGNVETVIDADIATINNEFVVTFTILIEDSIQAWEKFISEKISN